ncbi:MAG: UDP-N-acetylmuramate--L-alanine ligase [Clostridia bacterium]|nr:UDP-N-acetylmuramate--L-alanine ligase [Clostridia bacterium]
MHKENTSVSVYELERIFRNAKKIFFIGIGGISMSSLAEFCVFSGKEVFGYDRERNESCRRLEKICHIKYCSTPDSVTSMDLVIYTGAIDENNFELKNALRLKIPTVSRSNFLGYVMFGYRDRIGVSGAHGKSTVCAMLGHIFEYACHDPSIFCGAVMKEFCSASKLGKGKEFIFEACEYQNAFHSFYPTDAVVTNVEFDHPDFFKDGNETLLSFQKYISMAQRAYINSDSALARCLDHKSAITFGIEEKADYMAKNIKIGKTHTVFDIFKGRHFLGSCKLSFFGNYMVQNALCAFCVAYEKGIKSEIIISALESFKGIKRRAELIKRYPGKDVYLDYAHHPTEIRASLDGFKGMGYKKLLCAFQPHTYSRTVALYSDFLSSFSFADELFTVPVYEAREKNIYGYSDEKFASDINAELVYDVSELAKKIMESDCDCAIIMGAGDIEKTKKFIK